MNTEQKNANLTYLKNRYQDYYRNNPITPPDRFTRREYAYIFFGGKGMYRHQGYRKADELQSFIADRAPQHAYYSTAYYHTPDAAKMQDKGWMGAELIFDLDADHLPDAETMSYEAQLAAVKTEFEKLVVDFLYNDFGFLPKHTQLTFSGGRGYHCHIKDPNILGLDSNQRREIVDYITARDLDITIILKDHATQKKSIKGRTVATEKTLTMPKPTDPGWKGRISRGIINMVDDIMTDSNPTKRLQEMGMSKNRAEKIQSELTEERIKRIKEGQLDQSKTLRRFFLDDILRKNAVLLSAGETDEPVTCDIKRLIRLPGSLHGKTGLKVVELPSIKDLAEFDPLTDALVFSDKPTPITVTKETTITINKQAHYLDCGETEVPEYLAVFLIARKAADISI